jgi:tRNA (adenine57-N1/adenine58-N1)-methyltransferase
VLKDGGFFGSLVPTTNQVQNLLRALDQSSFGLIDVEEIMTRRYKPVADRLRPQDRMIAHTGFLIFARAIVKPPPAAMPQTIVGNAEASSDVEMISNDEDEAVEM